MIRHVNLFNERELKTFYGIEKLRRGFPYDQCPYEEEEIERNDQQSRK